MNGSGMESVRCAGDNGEECGRDTKYFGHSICRNGKCIGWQTVGREYGEQRSC